MATDWSRYADAVRVNEEAVAAQASLSTLLVQQQFTKTTDWDGHNLHFLWFGAVMEGRGDLAGLGRRRSGAVAGRRRLSCLGHPALGMG
jgi:hypothetical protein